MAALTPDDPLLVAGRVVVVDACSALDVIRIPVRPEWTADATSVEQVLSTADNRSALLLAIPAVIEAEFEKHRQGAAEEVLNTLRKHHNTLTAEAKAMADMLKRCRLTAAELPAIDVPTAWPLTLTERFVDLASTLHAALRVLPHDDTDVSPAYARVVRGLAPAVKGAASMNDSTLCEMALRIARQRPVGTTGLLTSNTSDFRPGGSLHPDLAADYASAGLVDLPTWRDAARFVTAPPTD